MFDDEYYLKNCGPKYFHSIEGREVKSTIGTSAVEFFHSIDCRVHKSSINSSAVDCPDVYVKDILGQYPFWVVIDALKTPILKSAEDFLITNHAPLLIMKVYFRTEEDKLKFIMGGMG